MLTPEERQKLEMFFRIMEISKEQHKPPQLGYYDVEWLCEKLKETNKELMKLKEHTCCVHSPAEPIDPEPELQVGTALYARKNDITDRWYSR